MSNLSPKWRSFVGRHRKQLNSILTLLLITVFISIMTGSFFPWLLIPIFFIGLSIVQDFSNTLMGETDDENVDDTAVDEELGNRYPTEAVGPVQQYSASYSPAIQAHMDKAHIYREQIESYIQASSDPHSQARLEDLSNQINEWTEAIEAMARRIDSFQQNPVIRQDLKSVPQAIEKLEVQLESETDPTIQAELERTLTNRKKQLATLQHLENMMKQAEIKVESALASLGTIYSQLLTSQSADHVADYGRLLAEVNEEVRTLQDRLEALEEVKFGKYN
jgi:hypothetical protein